MNTKIRDKEIEYEEAPSGFIKLYKYKEPFMKFQEGFGFEGVLAMDGNGDKIQCHLCGNWYEVLGNHLHREHNMKASDYKRLVGLRQNTALISEKVREKMVTNGIERFKNLKPGFKGG